MRFVFAASILAWLTAAPGLVEAAEAGPKPVNRVEAVTPLDAYIRGVEGTATVVAEVSDDGRVASTRIKAESPVDMGFGNAAAEAVRQWTFAAGRPGPYRVTMNFKPDPVVRPVLVPTESKLHYPRRAEKRGVQGQAVLGIQVGDGGKVVATRLISEAPESWGFGEAAVKSVSTWVFGTAKPGSYMITVNFRLK
jgi:TonB family protein